MKSFILMIMFVLVGCGYETDWIECKPDVAEVNPCIVECRNCGSDCIDQCNLNIIGESKKCIDCALTLALPECRTFMGWDGCKDECK